MQNTQQRYIQTETTVVYVVNTGADLYFPDEFLALVQADFRSVVVGVQPSALLCQPLLQLRRVTVELQTKQPSR